MKKNLVCALYNHPEAYPPTLNAIGELSKIYDNIYLIYRPNLPDLWDYPENVFLIRSQKKISVNDQASLSAVSKFFLFFSFTSGFLRACYKYKPQTILVYDSVALFTYHLIRKMLSFKHIIWYHSHDVADTAQIKKYSIGWWAAKAEQKAFRYLQIFSLPANERRKYFDLTAFKGEYFFVPNFPAVSFYNKFKKSSAPQSIIKFIFQGSISAGHGIEELMQFINRSKRNQQLLLIGNIEKSYRDHIINLSQELNIERFVEIAAPVNYAVLPTITASAHIGLAINKPDNIIYSTGGTASNKIYEYAACGLPVLYYDNEHYKEYLAKYHWAFANNLSMEVFERQVEFIVSNYESLTESAIKDFENELNFEKAFHPLLSFLQRKEKE